MVPTTAWRGQMMGWRLFRTEPKVLCFWCCLLLHLEPIMAAKPAWQLQQPGLGYRTPWDDDSDESVCFLPCGLHQIHPTGKQVWVTQTKHTPSLKHTHTGSNTHFLRSVLLAPSLISIVLILLVQILFTWSCHPGVESAWPQQKQQSPCTLEWKTTGSSVLGIC